MMMFQYVPVLLMGWLIGIVFGSNEKFTQFRELARGGKVTHQDIVIVASNVDTVFHCLIQCTWDSSCRSVNYNDVTKECELNKHTLSWTGARLHLRTEYSDWVTMERSPCDLAVWSGSYCYYFICLTSDWFGPTWNRTRDFCFNAGMRLPKIDTSAKQHDFDASVNDVFEGITGYVWIGGRKDGPGWKWTDGTPLTLRTPTDYGGDCVMAKTGTPTEWLSHDCNDGLCFSCERY